MPQRGAGHRSPAVTVERPGAGVKGSLRRFAPLTPVPVRSKTRHLRGAAAEWSGFCSARLSGGRDVARDVRRRRARDCVPCPRVAGRRRASAGVRRVNGPSTSQRRPT